MFSFFFCFLDCWSFLSWTTSLTWVPSYSATQLQSWVEIELQSLDFWCFRRMANRMLSIYELIMFNHIIRQFPYKKNKNRYFQGPDCLHLPKRRDFSCKLSAFSVIKYNLYIKGEKSPRVLFKKHLLFFFYVCVLVRAWVSLHYMLAGACGKQRTLDFLEFKLRGLWAWCQCLELHLDPLLV